MSAASRNRRQGVEFRRPLLPLALAAMLGIAADRCLEANWTRQLLWLWWFGASSCLLWGYYLHRRRLYRGATLLLLSAIVCLGGSWHHLRWHFYEQGHLARYATNVSEPVCVQGIAVDRIKRSPAPRADPLRAIPVGSSSMIQVRVTKVRDGRTWRAVAGDCRLRVNGELREVVAGDQLLIFAQLGRQPPALNPGEYDWAKADRGAGQYCDLYCRAPACVSVTKSAEGWSPRRWLQHIGRHCEQRLDSDVRPAQRDLAQAILLGALERLPAADRDVFFRTGTIHLLVVSGLHVGLLALAIWTITSSGLLPRQVGFVLSACLVVGYALVVGGRPPVMRASVLVVLGLCALAIGRRVSPANLLAAASLLVLAYNPSELFRSGTQLSFLCVAALAAYGHVLQYRTKLDPLTRLIRDSQPAHLKAMRWVITSFANMALASFAVWVVVSPLVAYHFHISAPISIVITPLLWPLVALALISGLAICLLGWMLPPLAWLLGEVCSLALWGTESIVVAASTIDAGKFYLGGPPGWWVLIFYLGLLAAALLFWSRVNWKLQLSLAALWVTVGLVATGVQTPVEKLRCTFLAVGHGTCVVLELPGGETMLYDAGSLGSPERASQTIASFLWSRGITRLDAVVLSHADVDHYNAVPGLLQRFDVRQVYISPLMFDPWINDGFLDAPEHLKATLEAFNVPLQEVWINDRLTTTNEEVAIEVLHPPRRGVAGKDNANSLLLAIRYAGHSILLPGDLESPGIEAVTDERPQHFDILLAPHHGSRNSDPPGFARWCTPNFVIVSGPRVSPSQQFTTDSYREVGAKVLHTANVGAVEFVIDRRGVDWSQFLNGE